MVYRQSCLKSNETINYFSKIAPMKNLHPILFFALSINFFVSEAQNQNNQSESINHTTNDITFTNNTNYFSNQNFSSFLVVGIADMNGDCLDDIIRLESGEILTIEYQLNGNQFENFTYGTIASSGQWNIAVADVDNNGFNDILIGGIMDDMKLFKANGSGTDYEMSILPNSSFFSQGSNFVDINNDGLADIFVCNDAAENRIWGNGAAGNFFIANDWIDMAVFPSPDNAGNYSSIWTDFDNDADQDLYISKCWGEATDPADPKRVNQLFVNENGSFTEQAENFGLNNGAQSWTSDFQDIDNDGDLDCFIVNHDSICQLFENDGNGLFSEITLGSGLNITTNHLQGMMRDFDNDGFVDILVAGNFGYEYFQNNGDTTFTKIDDLFGDYVMSTFAVGDLNHDGFLDVYSASSSSTDILWINDKNENNYFAVNLVGNESNINAIGARLQLYGPWGVQTREVRSGESYGIMNSFTQIFGLGTYDFIDSLVVKWPSGLKEVFESPKIDQFLTIVENDCAYPGKNIFSNGLDIVCSGDSLELIAPAGDQYLWSNGLTSQQIFITEGGNYTVTVTNNNGCSSISNPVNITQDPDETPDISVSGPITFCAGASLGLFSTPAESYLWSTGATSSSIVVFQSGEYYVTVPGYCGNFTSNPVIVTVVPVPVDPVVENDTITMIPDSATLTAIGNNLFWYDDLLGSTPVAQGPVFVTPLLSETTVFYVEDVNEINGVSCESDRVEVWAVVDTTLSANEFEVLENISIFPNPANQEVVIDFKNGIPFELQLDFIDITGRIVFSKKLPAESQQIKEIIPLTDFPSGVYVIRIHSNENRYLQKLIIQKD